MIKLQASEKRVCLAYITGNGEFKKSLSIVKSMPVREYDKKKNAWTIPATDISSLVKKCKIHNISIKGDDKLKEMYKDSVEWKKHQISTKNDVDEIYKEMEVLKLPLMAFQSIGAKFIYDAGDGVITDMVGLGKTVQSLAVITKHYKDNNINFFIIICPSTLKRNWELEVGKFTDFSVIVINGEAGKRKKMYKSAYKYDGMIINYDLLRFDIHHIDEFILQRGFEFGLIIDEIQYIKTNSAKRSKQTKNISVHAKYTIGLSATIIENTILDLWNSLHAINHNILGSPYSYAHFCDQYVLKDWFGDIIVDIYGELENQKKKIEKPCSDPLRKIKQIKRLEEIEEKIENLKTIKNRINPYTIRRFKEDVLEQLPDRIENNYWIELGKEQKKFYEDIKANTIEDIIDMEKAEKIKIADILPMITYLRQCSLSTKLVGHEKNISAKTDELIKILESIGMKKSKVLIFCHFTGMVDLLGESIKKAGYDNFAIHGKNCKDSNTRQEVVDKFNDGDIPVLITSDILKEGMNITSANYLINFDQLWNPAKMEQRIGRVDRIGNVHESINVINLIAQDTVEETMVYELASHKKQLFDEVIDGNRKEKRLTFKNIKSILGI